MPRNPDHENSDKPIVISELAYIERIMREEKVHAGAETILRPKTARALGELALCITLPDFKDLCQENRAWRVRRGETYLREL